MKKRKRFGHKPAIRWRHLPAKCHTSNILPSVCSAQNFLPLGPGPFVDAGEGGGPLLTSSTGYGPCSEQDRGLRGLLGRGPCPPLRMLPSARRQATQEPSSRGGGRRSQWADLEACYGRAAQLQVTVQARHEPLKKPTKNAIYVGSTKEYSRLLNCPSGSGTTCH